MRLTGLQARLEELGYQVEDAGDIAIAPATQDPQALRQLAQIVQACDAAAEQIERSLGAGSLPLVLGGDHSIAIGSLSGLSSFHHQKGLETGLIWFDAHADMNTPSTSPSGNIHGMPLSALLGHGHPALTELRGFSPKLSPHLCAHIGARDLDPGERALIRELGIRFFTMREIDERGMAACVRDAIAIASQASGGYAVTFDIDVMDPHLAPGSGTLVRGGLTYREAHLALELIAEAGGVRLVEMVEINPILDVNNRTAELGTELILSLLGKSIL
jgi:arginase